MIVKLVNKHNSSERVYDCITFFTCGFLQWGIVLPTGEITFYAKSRWDLYLYTKEGFVKIEKTL